MDGKILITSPSTFCSSSEHPLVSVFTLRPINRHLLHSTRSKGNHMGGPKIQQTKMLVMCLRFGDLFLFFWSGSILQFRQNIIKVSSKSWLLTYSSNINFIHWLCFEERELNFCNSYLSLLYF